MKKDFRRIFHVSMRKFMNIMTGFDLVAFDNWLKVTDDVSVKKFVKEKYGDEAVKLVKRIM